jgi:hypothetical protein
MNSSDEEKQLQLITSLKEQGRRQVWEPRPGLRQVKQGGGRCGRRGHPAAPSPWSSALRARPARLGEPRAGEEVRGSGRVGPGSGRSAARLGRRSQPWGRDRPTIGADQGGPAPGSTRQKQVGQDRARLGAAQLTALLAVAPPLHSLRAPGPAALLHSPPSLALGFGACSSFLPRLGFF